MGEGSVATKASCDCIDIVRIDRITTIVTSPIDIDGSATDIDYPSDPNGHVNCEISNRGSDPQGG